MKKNCNFFLLRVPGFIQTFKPNPNMSILGLVDFADVEKDVMTFIARNSGKLCTIHSIFNDMIEDRNITNPEIRNDLKVKLQIVMSQLNSKQSNVTVVKRGDNYLVGYNMDSSSTCSDKPNVDTNPTILSDSNPIDTTGLAKSMFEYIVDNDINYKIGINTSNTNLIDIGIGLGDYARVRKLKSKYSVSFLTPNSDGKNLMDMYPSLLFVHQLCIEELGQQIVGLKDEHLKTVVRLNNELIDLEREIVQIKKKAAQKNMYDLYVIVMIFIAIWWKLN
jgi:hypothetical protein